MDGIKPLYVLRPAQSLVSSSDLSALRASGAASELDADAIADYVLWVAYVAPASALVGVPSMSPRVIADWTQLSGLQVRRHEAMSRLVVLQAIDEAVASDKPLTSGDKCWTVVARALGGGS